MSQVFRLVRQELQLGSQRLQLVSIQGQGGSFDAIVQQRSVKYRKVLEAPFDSDCLHAAHKLIGVLDQGVVKRNNVVGANPVRGRQGVGTVVCRHLDGGEHVVSVGLEFDFRLFF